jgi:type II secretory pathway component PulF
LSNQKFTYLAIDGQGLRIRDAVTADNEAHAYQLLRESGLSPLRIRPLKSGAGPRLTNRRMVEFLRSLGILLSAGVPLKASLDMISEGPGDPRSLRLGLELKDHVLSGRDLADGLTATLGPSAFYVSGLVAAGQATGDLGGALQQAAAQLDEDQRLIQEFWRALSYPTFILVASVIAVTVLLTLVVPSIVPLIAQEGGETPLSLELLLMASTFMTLAGPFILVAVLVAAGLMVVGYRSGVLKKSVERVVLDGPTRAFVRPLIFGRFASVLGHLLAAGVTAPNAFSVACAGVQNGLARDRIEAASSRLFEGARISAVLAACPGVSGSVVQIAAIGEGTGQVGQMLVHAGRLEQKRAVQWLEKVGSWLAPTLIVLLGLVVGGVMAGLLGAVMSVGDAALG